jgi:tetratricopeptide (TPR) repeat protein
VDAAFTASFAGFTAALYTARVKELDASIGALAARQAVKLRVQQGVLHALFGKMNEAEAAFRAAIRDDPALVSSYVNLANVKLLGGDEGAALDVVNQGLLLNRDSVLLNLLAARLYADKGDAQKAGTYFAVVKKASPDLAERYADLAGGGSGSAAARAARADQAPVVLWDAAP